MNPSQGKEDSLTKRVGNAADQELFREEARRAAETPRHDGDFLRLSPSWARSVYWVLLTMVVAALFAAMVGRTREYASGPAVLRVTDETRVTALAPGTVERVEVVSGQQVDAGQPLVRFHSEDERNVLDHLQAEFDLHLVRLLRDPGDQNARSALAGLRAGITLAESRLAERTLVAPAAGWVQDVRIQPGQHLTTGEPVVSLVEQDQRHAVMAFLPARYRPQLEPGQPLRLVPAGYRHSRVLLTVEAVQEEAVGPQAARSMLEPQWSDAIALDGPVVVVTATLPVSTFRADGEDHRFFGGMQGRAEVRLRDRPILVSLVPGVEALYERILR